MECLSDLESALVLGPAQFRHHLVNLNPYFAPTFRVEYWAARPWRFDYTDPSLSDERLAAMWLLSGSLETG